ncbi:uncharacterized protein HaLaN_17616 [Haematococcus lacustris]|uniref:Uncharacterized protein n=1 Tax=Haematococcus lacustris TaxID=44745 RepID=A0A699ZNH8_HAELA|nr:uncharacterized protein HaLaN_17616 [Haematococcus lacustris]
MFYARPKQLLSRMKWGFWCFIALLVAHVLITAYLDPSSYSSQILLILMASTQVAIHVILILAFFVLSSQTLMVKLGRYDRYLQAFRLMYGTWLIELLLLAASKAFYLVWAIQRTGLCLFWAVAVYSAFLAFDPKWYDPDAVMHMRPGT